MSSEGYAESASGGDAPTRDIRTAAARRPPNPAIETARSSSLLSEVSFRVPPSMGAKGPLYGLLVVRFTETVQLPDELASEAEKEAEAVRKELLRRGLLSDTDEAMITTYAAAVVDARRLSIEVLRWPPESQEARRIGAQLDRARRTVASLATKLQLTVRARVNDKPEDGRDNSLLSVLEKTWGRACLHGGVLNLSDSPCPNGLPKKELAHV